VVRPQDKEYIDRALQGDQSAFTSILEAYWDAVQGHLRTHTQNTEDNEDLCLITFTQAFRSLHQFNSQYALATWLFAIADRVYIDFMRKKELKVTALQDSESGEDYVDVHHPTTTSSPDDLLIRAQQNEALRELMMQLAPTHRRILEMRFLKELSYAEIAENLKISVGTVKSKVFRATQLLREILRNSPPWNEV